MNKIDGLYHPAITTAGGNTQIELSTGKLAMERMARCKTSSHCDGEGARLAQPGPKAPEPHMSNYPPGVYEKILAAPD
ncbi:MAG: hypothetical protein GKR94_00520 [Gammaproteobacteria bacterium]|nr:hypothetical protein [Gammaproteobacteria bacterium]